MDKLAERLSSGKQINNASDDAAGLAASARLRSEIGGLSVAMRNVMEAGSSLQVADGALQSTEQMLVRMKELTTLAASSNSTVDLAAINSEIQMLQAEIDRVTKGASYNDEALLDGSYHKVFQVGDGDTSGSQIEIQLADASMSGLSAGQPLQTSVASTEDAMKAMNSIDSALDVLAGRRAQVGAYQSQLAYQQSNLQVNIENKIAAESTITDADIAKQMTEFTKTQILTESNTAMLAQANAASANIVDLFRK
jgi:flagellin